MGGQAGIPFIRAKETIYRGYRMRSRLEARWALFLDEIGLTWDYEAERWVVPDASSYLPDFYVPGLWQGVYLEVKPKTWDAKGDDPAYVQRLANFALNLLNGQRLCLCLGDPMEYRGVFLVQPDRTPGLLLLRFALRPHNAVSPLGFCRIPNEGEKGQDERPAQGVFIESGSGRLYGVHREMLLLWAKSRVLESAYLAARQARFEGWRKGKVSC